MASGNISICDVLNKLGVGIEDHNVEVLDCLDGLETLPVLEPDNLDRENELRYAPWARKT